MMGIRKALLRAATPAVCRCGVPQRQQQRRFSEWYRYQGQRNLRLRIDTAASNVGMATLRGDRQGNEDRMRIGYMNGMQIDEMIDGPFYFCMIDGHGGSFAADYVSSHLHEWIERAEELSVDDLHAAWKKSPSFRRRGAPKIFQQRPGQPLSMSDRLSLAFLKTDLDLMRAANKIGDTSGAVATAILISTLDERPFWEADQYEIDMGHVGDTRCLLAPTYTTAVQRISAIHHPENVDEDKRLRRSVDAFSVDSFGERRFGSLANTRAFGETPIMKRMGVISEPQYASIQSTNDKYAFIALVTDGVTDNASDDEIADIIRMSRTPADAARAVVSYCIEVNGNDNASCIVVRLGGWAKRDRTDNTRDLRQYKRNMGAPIIGRT